MSTVATYPGIFIAFDGQNGVGKGTLINRVRDWIALNYPVYELNLITEPSKSGIGGLVREFSEKPEHSATLLRLVQADREYNHVESIRPLTKLESKNILISDRYFSSTLVYQRMHGLSVDEILDTHSNIHIPDILFLLTRNVSNIENYIRNERKSNELFESPENVATEYQYFNEAGETLKALGYHISFVNNDDLEAATKYVCEQIQDLIQNKHG